MQEEVENRTVNLAISTTKLTGRTIIAGIRKYLQHREKVKMKKARDPAVHGKQSVKQLLGQNQGATNVEIDKESIRDFEKLAKKYGVDFAVRKDKSVDPPRFLVFVRSKDADLRKSRKRRRHRKRQSLTQMLIMWTMTRTMGTIRSLRTTMKIAPSMKMIMNLCKQDRLDAWGSLRVAFT